MATCKHISPATVATSLGAVSAQIDAALSGKPEKDALQNLFLAKAELQTLADRSGISPEPKQVRTRSKKAPNDSPTTTEQPTA